jgi:hypothetical protein
MTLLELRNLLLQAGIPVWHYEAEQEETPFIVYQEFSTSYSYASGEAMRESVRVGIAHYTKKEFDPSLELLKSALLKSKLGFTIATAFEPDAKIIINQFELTIHRDMEANS